MQQQAGGGEPGGRGVHLLSEQRLRAPVVGGQQQGAHPAGGVEHGSRAGGGEVDHQLGHRRRGHRLPSSVDLHVPLVEQVDDLPVVLLAGGVGGGAQHPHPFGVQRPELAGQLRHGPPDRGRQRGGERVVAAPGQRAPPLRGPPVEHQERAHVGDEPAQL